MECCLKSLSKLVTQSLNLNTDVKSRSVGTAVVSSEVVSVGELSLLERCKETMPDSLVLYDELWCPSKKQSHCQLEKDS
ncbi:hypothetical protein Tco_1253142 [Tanacetum coccineum]